jgi:hypothetical protein
MLSLGNLEYLADFGLDEKFKSFQFHGDGPITVEKGWPVFIRLWVTLRDELTDCPGLVEYLEKQPKGQSKLKCSADVLVSLIKPKTAQLNLRSGTSQFSQLIQIPSQSLTPEPFYIDLSLSSHSVSMPTSS